MQTGDALQQIVHSVDLAAAVTDEITLLTSSQEERARRMLADAGQSLGSVRAIARAMKEQKTGINRIHDGVSQMKSAADQIARGMDEQLRATRDLDRGLAERDEQINAIISANNYQQQASRRLSEHFDKAENRLHKNVSKTAIIFADVQELEKLTDQIKKQGEAFLTHTPKFGG